MNSDPALASSFIMRAMRPFTKRRVKGTLSELRWGLFSPNASRASVAAVASRSASANMSQASPTVGNKAGFVARIESIS